MTKVFSSIIELRQIKEQKYQLSKRETELGKAKIKDYTAIPRIKELFCKNIADLNKPYNRKKLLFIILYLFSPNTLAGKRLPKGLRIELTRIFPNIRPCAISNDISDLLFFYQHYKDFRIDVESLYEHILDGMTA